MSFVGVWKREGAHGAGNKSAAITNYMNEHETHLLSTGLTHSQLAALHEIQAYTIHLCVGLACVCVCDLCSSVRTSVLFTDFRTPYFHHPFLRSRCTCTIKNYTIRHKTWQHKLHTPRTAHRLFTYFSCMR